MREHTYVVIMAGGIGSRFWPYSRQYRPKQFLDILGVGKSLLRLTYERFLSVCDPQGILVVTNEDYAGMVHEHLPEIPLENILSEPARKNTAPCIAYAAYKIYQKDPKAVLVVAPSDHAILKEEKFAATVSLGISEAAHSNKLITLGIQPHRPDTGYGYIRYRNEDQKDLCKVLEFTEKPDLETSKRFLEEGDYLWNAGLFIWKAPTFIQAIKEYLPEMARLFDRAQDEWNKPEEYASICEIYEEVENISVDYGIMEKAENVYVIPCEFGWSDLGSWASLHEIREKDSDDNVIEGNVLTFDAQNCIIQTPSDKLTVVHDLDGYLVTEHENVLLICRKDEEKKFREFVRVVKEQKGEEYL
jgi:mannose-1-phosphate guanylyltransferase